MTKAGIKTEDYREITPYWCNRFLLQNGKSMSKEWWKIYLHNFDSILKSAIDTKDPVHRITFKQLDTNTMTLGYPSANDTERIIKFEHAGIEIRTGNSEWGADEGKLYFVIKHGKRI